MYLDTLMYHLSSDNILIIYRTSYVYLSFALSTMRNMRLRCLVTICFFNVLSANPTKWSNDHFVGLALKGLKHFFKKNVMNFS